MENKEEKMQNNKGVNLFALYKDYKSGNKQALNGLYSQQKIHKRGEKKYIEIIVKDKMLSDMVHKALAVYQSPSKVLSDGDYKKFTNSHFAGDYDDMAMIFYSEIQAIFDDTDFVQIDEKMLYGEVKRRVTISVNELLKNQDNSIEVYATDNDENGSGNPYDLDWFVNDISWEYQKQYQPIFCDNDTPKNKQHTSFISDILELITSVDLKSLLPKNAVFQRNLIDILYSADIVNYDEDGLERIASHKEISQLYYKRFGVEPLEEQVTFGLNALYKLLMEYYYGYVPIARCDFEKSDGIFNVHTIISENAKRNLLLSVIERFRYDFTQKGYCVDVEKIKEIIFENSSCKNRKQRYWALKIKNDRAIINEFYHQHNDCYSLIRNNDIKINGIPDIYYIGKCVVVADDMEKQLYYFNCDYRLRLVLRERNLYKGININLNNLNLNDLNIDEKDYKKISKSA